MIDFSLTEEQRALRDLVRAFVAQELSPFVFELDQQADPARCWLPWRVMERAQQLGLRTLTLSKEYGGAGIDGVTTALLIEEMCAGGGIDFVSLWRVVPLLEALATREQFERLALPFRDDPRFCFAAAITESDYGSDNILPFTDPRGGLKLSAEVRGDEVVLNGSKQFISNGPTASLYLVYARTDPARPVGEGTTVFLVPRDTPGLTVGRVNNRMGVRVMPQSEVHFEQCRVPGENQLTGWNTAGAQVAPLLRCYPALAGAIALGIARALFEQALEYARIRVQGGVPIIQHANVAMRLAEMFSRIEACRYLIWKACWNADHEAYFDPRLVNAPKVLAAQMARDVAVSALEIMAAAGVMKEVGLERLVRDALTMLHADGPTDVLLIQMGRALERGEAPLLA